ncbi:cytidine deaminase [Roseivivax halotolerans]|uniref:Cytidine deaminase n=1 Tax=Roseivivax halotolerans TaxID=93684 RepID=A0A1I5YQ77_9RHOB|nr:MULTISPECIES: hypothetical protein [Roseivivax]QFT61723.1 Blasticidin-S deaminase [Roseivivax sp. THAF30]SFQ46356.1 cytidine deaminase [Roseivivax halotolerans]
MTAPRGGAAEQHAETMPRLDPAHQEAVGAALVFIAEKQRGDWHSVASVVLTASGARYLGLNLDSTLPRASVCAEPVALGMAMAADPDDPVTFVAAVNRRGEVIPPCGPCRELMLDYAPRALVAIPETHGPETRGPGRFVAVEMAALMPTAYKHDRRKP